ncbi:MAG: amino acid-binding protein [Verrucomicrobia bacterium]|nr:amino acid-binding protein [Verrucomicrobiota bacterium]MBU1910196.1 amino acid-binding protein [Verrucomicrobiota bacterium]
MNVSVLHSVRKGRQIAVFLDDVPGTLSEVSLRLGRNGINIYALSLAEGIGHGYVRMVVDKPDEAIRVLREAEELVMERDVLLLELANAPGALGEVTRRLAEAKINVEYAYCAGGPGVDIGMVIVRVDQIDKALAVLRVG